LVNKFRDHNLGVLLFMKSNIFRLDRNCPMHQVSVN